MYGGNFLWEKGPREVFINEISKLEEKITNRTETRYENAQNNLKYKKSILKYLEVIKDMNINLKQSISDMDYMLDRIEEKYKYR